MHVSILTKNRNSTNLELILKKCKGLKTLDISNCKNITVVQICKIVENLDFYIEYLDITGIGELEFENFDIFTDYWFNGLELIKDLEKLSLLIPNTLIMPSVCSKCTRDTCYPRDTLLKCLFCHGHVYWVCDDCELVSYRICYSCVQEDSENGIDVVVCYDCISKTGQVVCGKCDGWKCPRHVHIDCGCGSI